MKKNILFIEPFYSGSHKSWLDQLKSRSKHNIELLTMPGRFWKWRMYGAALTMAEKFLKMNYSPDLIVVSDMLDLSSFLSLVRNNLPSSIPVYVYFHENQLAYPWSDDGEDKKNGWDINYGMMNYYTALSADGVFFNSKYNMDSFYGNLEKILKKMPDNKHSHIIEKLYSKSSVLPIGIDLKSISSSKKEVYTEDLPLIIWNHRWEFDKNPQDFFKALIQLHNDGIDFRLALLGEVYKNAPKEITEAISVLSNKIVASGYQSLEDYRAWLLASDISPVTSRHDFFGISVMETVFAGCVPLLPNRLTYPDLYNIEENPEIFYETSEEFTEKLKDILLNWNKIEHKDLSHITHYYDWDNLINVYDEVFSTIQKKS